VEIGCGFDFLFTVAVIVLTCRFSSVEQRQIRSSLAVRTPPGIPKYLHTRPGAGALAGLAAICTSEILDTLASR
jgi:hypothetical protein